MSMMRGGNMSLMRRMSADPEVAQHQLTRGVVRRILAFARPYRDSDHRLRRPGRVLIRLGRHAAAAVEGDHRRRRAAGKPIPADRARHHGGRAGRAAGGDRHGAALVLVDHRRGVDLRPADPGVRSRAADATGVLHPDPDRQAGVTAQLGRDRCAAGVHLDAVDGAIERDQPGAGTDRHAVAQLAAHPGRPGDAADLPDPGQDRRPQAVRADPAADGAERGHVVDDDRAVRGQRRAAGQALRAAGCRTRPVRQPGRSRPGRVGQDRHERPLLLHRAQPGRRAGHCPGVRGGRVTGHRRRAHRRHSDRVGRTARPAVRAAHPADQRPDRRNECAGQLRPGVRGAGPGTVHPGPGRCGAGHRAALDRVRPGQLHLPECRRDLAGQPGVDRLAGPAAQHRGAARRHLQRRRRARQSRWSVGPGAARPR